jgi:UDP-4-amino-4,6-dideoxy-N-acetyl-beta-L-altrosamine N-acetyltransferase
VLRDATDADVPLIRTWRNHPRVRGVSIYTPEITPDGHAAWWAGVRADPGRHVLIFADDGIPAGVVTFTIDAPGHAEWGFFLDVDGLDERGRMLPAWMEMEKEAVAYGFDDLGLDAMGGRTLVRNAQVIALHRRFGFVEIAERRYTTEVDGVLEEVVWTELSAERHRARSRRS